ncbi:hypothetical protein [Burkholderia metallica]|uniref:hypothetical protein n=1 Tax=Burkholderia metallica TaxID=488729 RepID=UPI0015825F27|nr:hypothetical protein [Burkholderia metallica]
MIPNKTHSPSPPIIHRALFCRPALSVNDAPTRSLRRSDVPAARFRRLFPGIFFRIVKYECVIFSETSALPFSFPENRQNDYKSKLK